MTRSRKPLSSLGCIVPCLLLGVALSAGMLAVQQRPEDVPSVPTSARFVASSRGQVYYPVGCDAWHELSPGNLLFFPSRQEAEERGHRPTRDRRCRETAELSTLGPVPDEDTDEQAPGIQPPDGRAAGVCVVERVVDGDTVDCAGGVRIRLLLIDAPEMAQSSFGLRAKLALEELAPEGASVTVRLDVQERDRYSRVLGHLFLPDGTWINRAMARRGYAVALVYPPNVWRVKEIQAAADSARTEGVGLWELGGFACLPREYRRGACER